MKTRICCALICAFAVSCGDAFPVTPCPDGTEQDPDTGLCIKTVTVMKYPDPEIVEVPVDKPFPCKADELEASDGVCVPIQDDWVFPCTDGMMLTQDGRCVVPDGTLTAQIAYDAEGTPDSQIILGNSVMIPVATYRLNTTREAKLVRTLMVSNCVTAVPDTDGDCADPGETPGNDAAIAAVHVTYLNQADEWVMETESLFQGTALFNNLDMRADRVGDIRIAVDTNAVSDDGVASGSQIQLNLNALADSGSFEAVGEVSGTTFTERDLNAYIVANPMVIRRSKPTVSLAQGFPYGPGIPGFNEVFRFNIAADSHGDVGVNQVVFEITSTDNDHTGWNTCTNLDFIEGALYDMAHPSVPLPTASYGFDEFGGACGPDTPLRYLVMTFDQLNIPAGEIRTFPFKLDTTGASSDAEDNIRVDIIDQEKMDDLNFQSPLMFDGSLTWTDGMASHINGAFIKHTPVIGGVTIYYPTPP